MAGIEEQIEDALQEPQQSDGHSLIQKYGTVVERPVPGVLVTKSSLEWRKEKSTFGIFSLEMEDFSSHFSVTGRDFSFFSREDEDAFLSCCYLGPEFMSNRRLLPNCKTTISNIQTEYYRSKIRHTWITVATLKCKDIQSYTLTPQAIQALHDLRNTVQDRPHNVKSQCIAFLERFGSHVFKGPLNLGGRLVQKVSCVDFNETVNIQEVDNAIEDTFDSFIHEESPMFEDMTHIINRDGTDDIIQLEKSLLAFPAPEAFSDYMEWKAMIGTVHAEPEIIGYTVTKESLVPVWEFIRKNNSTFGEYTFKLCQSLFQTWQNLSGVNEVKRVFEDEDTPDAVSSLTSEDMYSPSTYFPKQQHIDTNQSSMACDSESDGEYKECIGHGEEGIVDVNNETSVEDEKAASVPSVNISTETAVLSVVKAEDHATEAVDLDDGHGCMITEEKRQAETEKSDSVRDSNENLDESPTNPCRGESEMESKRKEIRDLLSTLGLSQDYPCKTTSQRILAINPPLNDSNQRFGEEIPIAMKVFRKIMSLDFRGRQGFITQIQEAKSPVEEKIPAEEGDIFAQFQQSSDVKQHTADAAISSLDVMFTIIHCCDPFLKQDILSKMAECQLAVPVLLPHFDASRVTFLVWCLRKIRKKWRSKLQNNSILEESVVSFPIPIVSFIRIGTPEFSKSKLLNKLIGPLQGNNEHPYFVDKEHEVAASKWAQGSVEAVWYMPEGGEGSNEVLTEAVAFFNLRGNASRYPTQTQFVCRSAILTVVILDKDPSSLNEARNLAKRTQNLVVIMNSDVRTGSARKKTLKQGNVTMIDGTGRAIMNLCEEICARINGVLSSKENPPAFQSLEDISNDCTALGIEVDEKSQECVLGKSRARNVLASTYPNELECAEKTPAEYKRKVLPLQGTYWKKWAHLDKRSEKLVKGSRNESIEHFNDDIARQKKELRKLQVRQHITDEVSELIVALQSKEKNLRKYFLTWFQFRLNEMSRKSLGPLIRALRSVQNERRGLGSQIREMADASKSDLNEREENRMVIQQITEIEKGCLKKIKELTKEFDDNSLGPEHFMREIGQIYEAHVETNESSADLKFNVQNLPHIAADMLIDGHPIEILDGDVGHVPIKWVNAVLESVKQKLDNPVIHVVSVIGIQSSGKSTLLNNIFGLSFAVSAGRCTRGIFIQLIPVLPRYREEVGCEFLVVVDTEGLKAPERALMEGHHHDNELATFALCLSDLTLINISGQTIGEDMTDILQIAAYAFIRMKEVQLKSTCRIVQQFVSDLAAVDKNETGTQSILVKLDEATAEAGKEEGFGNRYQRFSDVFDLKLDPNLQYIPNLYGGSMSPPNHRYSETIQRLKEAIIKDIKGSAKDLSFFIARINDVWNAVKEEDFIFSFQNSMEALQYKQFQFVYGKWVAEIRQVVMEWELKAKQIMKNTHVKHIEVTRRHLQSEIVQVISSAKDATEAKIHEYLYDNVKDADILQKHEAEFCKDLDLIERDIKQTAWDIIDRQANAFNQLNDIHVLLPKCRSEIRVKAQQEAVKLRDRCKEAEDIEYILEDTFDTLWKTWMKDIEYKYPQIPPKVEDVMKDFDNFLTEQGRKVDLTKQLKNKLKVHGGGMVGYVKGGFKKLWHEVLNDETELVKRTVNSVIIDALQHLRNQIADDMAYDPNIVQELIFRAINGLGGKQRGVYLNSDKKVDALLHICVQAISIIQDGRIECDRKYSLRSLLLQEKTRLKDDFIALCSDRFQDQRAAERLYLWLKEVSIDVIRNSVGMSIYRTICEKNQFITNKFSLLGTILYDIGKREDFKGYYHYVFENKTFMEEWVLNFFSQEILQQNSRNGRRLIDSLLQSKVDELIMKTVEVISETSNQSAIVGNGNVDSDYQKWLDVFVSMYQNTLDVVCETENFDVLRDFQVKSCKFFTDQVKIYIDLDLKREVVAESGLSDITTVEQAKELLTSLPLKPHVEIGNVVQGCDAQCPFCKAPCDIMTKEHDKHRVELHYPEGIIGCALSNSKILSCNICTSSVTSNTVYQDVDSGISRKYKNYVNDYPKWYIQPIQNDSPNKYWRWVLATYNKEFAEMFSVKKANIPVGWREITKDEALESLAEAYLLQPK